MAEIPKTITIEHKNEKFYTIIEYGFWIGVGIQISIGILIGWLYAIGEVLKYIYLS